MRQESTFRIFGVVENVETGSRKISSNDPCAQVHISVYGGKPGLIDRYRATVYDAALVAVAETLRQGQQVCIVGRLRGGVNERGYYNYYLNAQAILIEPSAPGRPVEQATSGSYVPPRNGREAAQKLAEEDIPF